MPWETCTIIPAGALYAAVIRPVHEIVHADFLMGVAYKHIKGDTIDSVEDFLATLNVV